MQITTSRIGFVSAAAAAALAGWGCSADTFNTNSATIAGRVENRAGDGITGIRVGVIYQPSLSSPGVLPTAAATAGPALGAAYPNPLTESSGGVTIPLTGVADTTLAVEIRSEFGGVAGNVRNLFSGPVAHDTTLAWDGQDDTFRLVPNGRYQIRLTVYPDPPSGAAPVTQEATFIVNRSQAIVEFYDAYNAQSDVDGTFLIEDLAVGAHFLATNASGTPLGDAFLANQVTLMFRDPEFHNYLPDQTTVAVGPRESVDVTKVLDSTASPRLRPDTR